VRITPRLALMSEKINENQRYARARKEAKMK
jgi:hypothetical protein